ncbi:MAG: dihydropteroate synthase [Actinobacteria bacterium]|jgi:dihydropteroate synthase|nr:dihydropteroate synthase [Actinomycetota bacterium]
MINLENLSRLYAAHSDSFTSEIAPLMIGEKVFDRPALMATVNLSPDSTYRESIAVSTEAAVRKSRVYWAQGADVVDLGAESSTAKASRVGVKEQISKLVPVIEELSADAIAVSVETYEPEVVRACLSAGAKVVNYTGTTHQAAVFDLASEFSATVILCYVAGADVREITDVDLDKDPIPGLLDYFSQRLDSANKHGVTKIVIDPGMGFYYGNLVDPITRVKHQTRVILNSFRLKSLGYPICQALPHAFNLFEDEFRTAESFFAVIASLGGVNLVRTHEIARVNSVLKTLQLDATLF